MGGKELLAHAFRHDFRAVMRCLEQFMDGKHHADSLEVGIQRNFPGHAPNRRMQLFRNAFRQGVAFGLASGFGFAVRCHCRRFFNGFGPVAPLDWLCLRIRRGGLRFH